VVLPDGFLFGEGIKTRIKEKLLTECNLHTIVRLPNGVFNPYTGIKTNLLFFTKGRPTKEVWFYEHPYPAGVKNYYIALIEDLQRAAITTSTSKNPFTRWTPSATKPHRAAA
jgi:type I restriction-modification system DNA methylase subunit